jgi:hypothetical protein
MNTYQTQVTTSSKVGEGFPLPPFVLIKPFATRVVEGADPYRVLLIPHCVILSEAETRGGLRL